MKASTTTKTIVSVATCTLAGVLLLQCGPTDPITQANGGNAGGGVTGTSPAAGAGGNSAAGNGSGGYIISSPPPAGGSTASSSRYDAAPASPDANCGTQTQNPTPQLVDLLLVLDRSGSMADDIATDTACTTGGGRRDAAPCSPKWPAMTASLKQVLTILARPSPVGFEVLLVANCLRLHSKPRSGRRSGARHRCTNPDRDGQHVPGRQHSDHGRHQRGCHLLWDRK